MIHDDVPLLHMFDGARWRTHGATHSPMMHMAYHVEAMMWTPIVTMEEPIHRIAWFCKKLKWLRRRYCIESVDQNVPTEASQVTLLRLKNSIALGRFGDLQASYLDVHPLVTYVIYIQSQYNYFVTTIYSTSAQVNNSSGYGTRSCLSLSL